MFLSSVIEPGLKVTDDKLVFSCVKPTFGDYLIVFVINSLAIPLSWYTTKDYFYAALSLMFYWILSYSLIDDEFSTEIDLKGNEIRIQKCKTGRVKWIRVSQADELINAEVVEIRSSKKESATSSYRYFQGFDRYLVQASRNLNKKHLCTKIGWIWNL